MIQVDGLSMAYAGHVLFDDATFSIQPNERCGLVGRNGSGKTTVIRILSGKEEPDQGNIAIRKNYQIGVLDQHIRFTQNTLLEEAALGLRPEDQNSLYKAEAILFGLGFKDEDMERNPKEFSGGYQLRLHLAKVLISEPNCLLLDEPTNYLDIVSIRWFMRFLQQWKGEFILISHDREFMDSVTTHTMGIHRQKMRKIKGDTVQFYEQIFQEEEIHEKTRVKIEKKRSHAQSFIDRFGAKASKATQAQSRAKMLSRIPTLEKLKGIYNLDFEFNEAPFAGKKMLEVQNLDFSYNKDGPLLIQDLSFPLEKGERVAIIGKNGRGKSTILRLLAQELVPLAGSVNSSEHVRIGYFGQTNIDRLHPNHTIEEEISSSNPKLNRTQVKGICGLMMFTGDKSEKPTSVLSGGEKSRVLLGKILAGPCNLLLLDEPTHHLDMESIEALIDAIEDFNGGVVIVTHSELILKRLQLNKIIVCHEGRQDLFLGTYEEFLENDGWHDRQEQGGAKKKKEAVQNPKQDRSEIIAARAKALKPLNQKIAQLEDKITQLEKAQEKAVLDLAVLSQKGNSQAIQDQSKAIAAEKKIIENLYIELEALHQTHQELSAE